MKVYILNPGTKALVSIDDWSKEKDPTRANYVILDLGNGKARQYYKNRICDGKAIYHAEAMEAAASFEVDGFSGFTLESRRESLDAYDAKADGFAEAVKLIGGNIHDGVYWTRENVQSHANNAWFFYGAYGYLNYGYYRVGAYYARVFRAFDLQSLDYIFSEPQAPRAGYEERMLDEWQQVNDRVSKLGNFIDGEVFNTLPTVEQADMRLQFLLMKEYAQVLGRRCVRKTLIPVQ